jgi:hypothetical protein
VDNDLVTLPTGSASPSPFPGGASCSLASAQQMFEHSCDLNANGRRDDNGDDDDDNSRAITSLARDACALNKGESNRRCRRPSRASRSPLMPSSPAALGVVVSHRAFNRALALVSSTESLSKDTRTALLLLDDRPLSSSYLLWSIVHLDSTSSICPKRQWRHETNNECAVVVVVPSTNKRIALLASTEHHVDPTPVTKAILACNDAYSRALCAGRAKIASWRHRATHNLLVPEFGTKADTLLSQTQGRSVCCNKSICGPSQPHGEDPAQQRHQISPPRTNGPRQRRARRPSPPQTLFAL